MGIRLNVTFTPFGAFKLRKLSEHLHFSEKRKEYKVGSIIFFITFAKNTAHNERRLKINAYLCIVAENPSQT